MSPRLVLLDRDGTLNVKAPEGDYVTTPEAIVLLPGAARAVRRLNDAGAAVAVITNQRGVALGRMSADDLDAVHAELERQLAEAGAHVDAIYSCTHDHGACTCRKPLPGLLRMALRDFEVAPREAVMVGDAPSDAEAGRRAGTRTIQLMPRRGALSPHVHATAFDLEEAVERILGAAGRVGAGAGSRARARA